MFSNLKQFILAFLVTLTCVLVIVKSGLPLRLSYQVERGRLTALQEMLPADNVLEARYLDGRRVAEIVGPAVVSIVSDRQAAMSDTESAAHTVGLRRLDIIERIDGESIRDTRHFALMIAARSPGERMWLGIVRDGQALTVEVTLGRRYAAR